MRTVIMCLCLLALSVPVFAMNVGSGEVITAKSDNPSVTAPDLKLSVTTGETRISYDSDPYYYFPSLDSIGAEWAVRFTPPQACSLVYFELTTYSESGTAGDVALTIYEGDSVDGPGAALTSAIPFAAAGDASRQQIEFDVPLDVGSSDFFIAIKVLDASSPHVTGDADGGTGRSWYKGPTQAWDWVEDVDMNIRAFVKPYGADVSAPSIEHYPDAESYASDGQTVITAGVADGSGVQSVSLHFSTDGGLNYQKIPMSLVAGLYSAGIPAQPPMSVVKYYLEATDSSPEHNKTTSPADGQADPYQFTTLPGNQLKYDNGWPAQFLIVSDIAGNDNAFATLFTPPTYPILVTKLRVYVNETAPFKISITRAGMNQPGDPFAGPYTISANSAPGWAEIEIPELAQPIISAGHYYVVVEWLSDSPTAPGVGSDTTQADGRSMWYDKSQGWTDWPYADWMIRTIYTIPTSVFEEENADVPKEYELAQNYPNPFNPETTIRFTMPKQDQASLIIYNVLGQTVRTYDLGLRDAGTHSVRWDGRSDHGESLGSGVYFYRLVLSDMVQTRKMLLMK